MVDLIFKLSPVLIFIVVFFHLTSCQNIGTCVDQEAWCSFADPDCNKDRVKAICPKSCNTCLDGDTPGYIFENDIVVYDDDYDYSLPDAVGSVSRLWNKNGTEVIIPYTMPEGVTTVQLREINRAIDEFHQKTCIRFQQRTNELDYVIIDPVNHPMSCHSAVGKKGGPQKVRCGNCKIDGAFHYGRILHELFHVVGFAHEQGRPDRDQFITIDFQAIAQIERDEGWPNGTWQNQFLMCNETRFGRKYGCKTLNKYDYASISHYPNVLGEDHPRVVFVNKTACGKNGCQFGQRLYLSPLDVADVEKVYQCGITFRQHKALCNVEIAEESSTKETQIRNEQINEMCAYVDCTVSKSLELCPRECFRSNNTEEGIWYHNVMQGTDITISHDLPNLPISCTVNQPEHNHFLHISNPPNPFFQNDRSEDNGRISLSTSNNKSCQLTIKGIKFEDNGEWIFSLQFQQNKTIKKNLHHILVRHNETFSTAICRDKEMCNLVSTTLCQKFPSLKKECPVTCRQCTCQDVTDCSDISTDLCDAYPTIRDKCRKTCGVCQSHPCFPNPCNNGGICSKDRNGGYNCNCSTTEHYGPNCNQRETNCIWAEWNCWGQCSKTCGVSKGTRERSRIKTIPEAHGGTCNGVALETEQCRSAINCPPIVTILSADSSSRRPLLQQNINVVANQDYTVTVEVMVTDLDDNNEYIDVSINSNNVGRCNPTGVTEGSCEWWTCSISPSQTFSTTTSLSVRLKYSKYVGYYENYKCTYNGKTSHAIARVTLTEV